LLKAPRAPIGVQVNLYPRGLSTNSGEGNPPHHDSYSNTFYPFSSASSKIFIVARWSIPGSSPHSFKNNKFFYLAALSSCAISGAT